MSPRTICRLALLVVLCSPRVSRAEEPEQPAEWRSRRRPPQFERAPNSEMEDDQADGRSRLKSRRGKRGTPSKVGASEIEIESYFGAGFTGTYSSEAETFGKIYSLRTQFQYIPGLAFGVNFDFAPAEAVEGAEVSANWGFSAGVHYYFQGRTLLGPWVQIGGGFLRSDATLADGTKVKTTIGTAVGTLGWRLAPVPDFNLALSGGVYASFASGGSISFLPSGTLEAGVTF